MLILKNVTAVQLHPAKVQEGVDIAIENDGKHRPLPGFHLNAEKSLVAARSRP